MRPTVRSVSNIQMGTGILEQENIAGWIVPGKIVENKNDIGVKMWCS